MLHFGRHGGFGDNVGRSGGGHGGQASNGGQVGDGGLYCFGVSRSICWWWI